MASTSDIIKRRDELGYQPAADAYQAGATDRKAYETRAKDCSKVTISSLFGDETADGSTTFDPPYNTIGARGVNNLASKLMLSLFPTERWLRLDVSQVQAEQIVDDPEQVVQIDDALTKIEEVIVQYFETNLYRVPLFEGIKLLLVTGNFCMYMPEIQDKSSNLNPLKIYTLYNYICRRDNLGNTIELVLKDTKYAQTLPEEDKEQVRKLSGDINSETTIDVYTHVFFDSESNTMKVYEQYDGFEDIIEGSEAEYPVESCPYVAVRMIRQVNENYGRSYCEQYYGDLNSLEKLRKAILDSAAMAAHVVFLVNPSGITKPKRLNEAANGAFVAGRKEDIATFQLDKMSDLSIAQNMIQEITMSLTQAFLLQVSRNAERVTAEEVRAVTRELEAVLGGVYSVLTKELQLPMVYIALRQLAAADKIADLPEDAVSPVVTTGIDAMGRGQDVEKLSAFTTMVNQITQIQDPQVNKATLIIRAANALGIKTLGLLRSAQEMQQQQAEEAAQQGMGAAAQSAGSAMGADAAMAAQQQMGG